MPGPLPAGNNVRQAAVFKRLEAEVRRMDLDGPAAVDWSKVNTLSLNILSNRSKDILVACRATYGLFRVEGYEGLAVGLGVLRGLVEAHWEGLFPPVTRDDARAAAIDWLLRLGPALAANEPTEADASAVIAACDALDGLARALGGKPVNRQVTLDVLFRALQSYYERATIRISPMSGPNDGCSTCVPG
ncbi:type VI secretion system ImpA family N-terminal domain-containing protein [Bradyrhizobium sp. Arg62]|uniref:type VI secretion system ImpA family N-terminal domain-containing protein n=1 Tax=Bradyrhizobium TaxID=374 RepID=UPI0027E2EFA9|nr:type VI secretion system ImpA family N-terminal domain-containing protein [Bradyrhizobium ivorense]MCC8938658.1 type VI secretion system ImpA family N-terminal domain-containing protein [Bradyrhizobium ivorense]MCC8948629.1 type VI secretion system ImpA family N-terminal domain-containing protein [Bradyrhizobium brasilense]